MKGRILFLPGFDRIEDLRDSLGRAAFHLAHADPGQLTFIIDAELVDEAEQLLTHIQVPDDFDPDIDLMVERIAGRVHFIEEGSRAERRAAASHDVVAIWDIPSFDSSPWAIERGIRNENRTIFEVDSHNTRFGASKFAMIADRLSPTSPATEYKRFECMLEALPQSGESYLFGSGPSIREALDRDFSNSIRIVCNTVILD